MENYNLLKTNRNIHFIGIGGISMSGLSEILHRRGYRITGSDSTPSKITRHLEELGIRVYYGHHPDNLPTDAELIVHTAAVKDDNPEMMEAKERGLPVIDRALLLGIIMKWYKNPIAVSGTHGKTTTTSMISEIFLAAELDPTITLGGVLPAIGGNFRMGGSENFIAESCEYFDSFLKFYPRIGIILNIEEDHLDYFKNLHHIETSFHTFALNIPKDGTLVINGALSSLKKITEDLPCKVITYGTTSDHWYAENISIDTEGRYSFDLIGFGDKKGRISLSVYGKHNIENALAACAASVESGVDMVSIQKGIANFKGTCRRFEYKGSISGIEIFDDYAHHPTEIRACLQGASLYPHNNLWCVFQPHNYSRTKTLLDEFGKSFVLADKVVLLDIYSNRETNPSIVHSLDLLKKVKETGKEAHYFSSFEEAETFLLENCFPKDLLITMGAGDVYLLGESMLRTGLSTLSTG